jgi:tetratricopeptide (TPR) repeat protein
MKTEFVGKQLGEFEIVRELGRGGMGVVYEAVQTSLNRRVALKVLGLGLGLTPRAVDRFRREAEAAAKLHHTNIVPVYATGEHEGTHFYAMELIEGPSLDRVVKELRQAAVGEPSCHEKGVTSLPDDLGLTVPFVETPVTTADAGSGRSSKLSVDHRYFDIVAGMIADVADALDHAHNHKVLHRDIKPANLLLAPDGRLSINDFGLSRMLEQPGMTMTGEFVGTPTYMSPEQITSGLTPVDHRTDIYSLGATLYELCTLQAPFVGERRDQVLAQVLQKEPKPLRSINKQVPIDLETICLKCLEKDPKRRYQSGRELAEDLRRFVNRYAISARRVGLAGRTKKWMKRNPAVTVLLAAVMLAVGMASFFAWRAHQADQLRLAEDKRREEQARIEKRQEVIRSGMVLAMAGDFAGVNKAMDEAIGLEADAADIRILLGFAALHEARIAEAVEHYERAVDLRPDSVMARAGLTQAYLSAAEFVKGPESYGILLNMSPKTPEDLLFKGWAITEYDEAAGVKLIEEAMGQKRNLIIGHLLLAGARVDLLYHSKVTMDDLQKTLEVASTALGVLDKHPASLTTSLRAQMAAVTFYGVFNMPAQRENAIKECKRLEALLAEFPDNTDAARERWTWRISRAFDLRQPLEISPDLFELCRRKANRHLTYLEGDYYFRRGRDQDALNRLSQVGGYHHADLTRFMATLNADEFAAEREKLLSGAESDSRDSWRHYAVYLMRLAYGRTSQAIMELRKFLDSGGNLPRNIARWEKYVRSDAADWLDVLLRSAGDSRQEHSRAYFEKGLIALGKGDRESAQIWLVKAAELGDADASSKAWSTSILERMRLQPDWPKLIKAKN